MHRAFDDAGNSGKVHRMRLNIRYHPLQSLIVCGARGAVAPRAPPWATGVSG